jgi:hypothetical protein
MKQHATCKDARQKSGSKQLRFSTYQTIHGSAIPCMDGIGAWLLLFQDRQTLLPLQVCLESTVVCVYVSALPVDVVNL